MPDYSRALTGGVRGLRLGVPTRFFADDASPEVAAAYRAALDTLKGLGAALVDVDVPHAPYATSAGWVVAMAEAAAFHETRLRETPELFDPVVRERLDAARFYTATDYIKAQRVRARADGGDGGGVHPVRCHGRARRVGGTAAARTAGRRRHRRQARQSSRTLPRRQHLSRQHDRPAGAGPAVRLLRRPPALPIGLQLYGRAFDEVTLFQVGHAYEQATDWHKRRPPLS